MERYRRSEYAECGDTDACFEAKVLRCSLPKIKITQGAQRESGAVIARLSQIMNA